MTEIVNEIDRPDGVLPVTIETVSGLVAEVKRLRAMIEQQAASLAAKDKEISTLKMALDDETSGISAECRDADTPAAGRSQSRRGPAVSDDLIERLRHAHEHSQQRIVGSNIFQEAATALEAKDAEIERLKSGWHDCISDLTAAQKRAEQAERALAEAVTVIQQGEAATNAAYSQAMAEYHGHDKTADKHDRTVTAFRHAARAFVAQHGSDSSAERK
jgi:chromosome segregation ATPase